MTAIAQEPQLPPRLLIRAVWLGQRTAYRLTGGRFGLATPEAGKSFGMLRLATVGRRTGKARVAIIGYYQDGENLVTLAMNGWGKAEPAWWLNLQANPEAVVRLPGAELQVRARVATGEERARLWAKFDEFPGWGTDLDGLAARRPMETSIVVFEPRHRRSQEAASTSRATSAPTSGIVRGGDASTEASSRTVSRGGARRLRLRHLWIIPGLGIAFFANFQAAGLGVNLVPLLLFGILPDIPRAVGLHRRYALSIHNLLHQPALPIAMLVGTAITGVAPFAYIGALAWLGHVVVGWGTGDRVRPVASAAAKAKDSGAGQLVLAPEVARKSLR